jgi:methyltransferase
MEPRAAAFALLAGVALERGVELVVSSRNARRLLAAGGVEHGRGHYPVMVVFHASFLVACAAEPLVLPAPWPAWATAAGALGVALAQALRWWAVAALGGRWTTRIVTLPGAALAVGGPYRWLRHPNYLAVAVELAALPLALGAWRTAIAAALGNAALMAVRIPAEERALCSRGGSGARVAPASAAAPLRAGRPS